MEWTQLKLPFPVYQQEPEEKCLTFLKRKWVVVPPPSSQIEDSLQPATTSMIKEDAVFWFLLGCREDIVTKIPFNPSVSNWIDPFKLEGELEKIDKGEELTGPFRACRLQDCFNYNICNKCGHWGHRVSICRNQKLRMPRGGRWKRKMEELRFNEDSSVSSSSGPPRSKTRHSNFQEDENEDSRSNPWILAAQQQQQNHPYNH